MLGDLMGMMGKLKDTQAKIQQTKERLDHVTIEEESSGGLVKVVITANRSIKGIAISATLLNDRKQLEDHLVLTVNKAIEKATKIQEDELAAVAKEGMPNIPGMDSLFK